MKKSLLKIGLLLSVAPLLASCATRTDVEGLQRQLRIVNKKIEDMKADTVDRLQKRQAAAIGQMDQLEQDMLELKNQLEESYYLNQRLREQNKELEQTISTIAANEASQREEALRRLEEQQRVKEERLKEELEQKLRLQEESVRKIQQARIKEAERRAREAAIEAELARKKSSAVNNNSNVRGPVKHIKPPKTKKKYSVVAPPVIPNDAKIAPPSTSPTPPAVTKTTPKAVSPQIAPVTSTGNEFDKAEELYERKKYSEAFKAFEQIASTAKGSQSVDARYMAGESLFAQKEYDKAIMQYQQIIAKHGSHAKAPAAMLKQAMAFEKLADKDTAKVIYKKVLKKHGSSEEAATAQQHLDKL